MRNWLQKVYCIGWTIILIACSKNEFQQPDSTIPNFGNIAKDSIFSDVDRYLPNRKQVVSSIHQYYQNIWEKGDLWGGFLVAKGDDILYENYRGLARTEMPIDRNTPLHIASVSKPITAMAVLKLVEAGKLHLNDPLTKFFPKFPYPKVTIKTLLNQRSGLPKYEYLIEELKPKPKELEKPFLNNQDVLNLLIKYQPNLARPTDTGFMYCNTNYALLALIIEKITKLPFPKAMKTIVFEPLKMKYTYIFQEKDITTATVSFLTKNYKEYPFNNLDLIYGDKNVYTTPRDLLIFSQAMYSNQFLNNTLKKQIFIPYSNEKKSINNYGLGFRMKCFDNGKKLTYHNGWWHGNNSVFVHLQDSKTTIIALGNKYSRKVYSAVGLSAIFEDFPFELKEFQQADGIHSVSKAISFQR